jgi:hypothetical protein
MVLIFPLNAFGNYLEPNAREQLPLGAKIHRRSRFGNPRALFKQKPFVLGEKNPAVWYSNSAY